MRYHNVNIRPIKYHSETATPLRDARSIDFVILSEKSKGVYGTNPTVQGVLIFKSGRRGKDLQPGDVILQIDQQEVSRPDDVVQMIETARKMGRPSVMLTIQHSDEREAIELSLQTE